MYKSKSSIWYRWFSVLAATVLVFQLSGCGSSDAKQRSAFMAFLQTEVINKVRVNIPPLTDAQKKEFGDYSQQYLILTGFHDDLRLAFAPIEGSIKSLQSMGTVQQMVENRQSLVDAIANINDAKQQLADIANSTEAARASLVQPDDLKVVFDEAYAKVVTKEIEIAQQALPLLSEVFTDALSLVDFIQSKGESVTLANNSIEFSEQADVDTFNTMNQKLQDAHQKYATFAQSNR